MTSPLLQVEQGATLILTLNRPEKRNALNLDMLHALIHVLETFNQKRYRVLFLKGAGSAFCSGADLSLLQDEEKAEKFGKALASVFKLLQEVTSPTVAYVHGIVMAGGLGLMASCDFVVADPTTTMATPEVQRGLLPAQIALILRRQLSDRSLRKILLSGLPFSASDAKEMGLITYLADQKAPEELIKELLLAAPEAQKKTKQLLRFFQEKSYSEQLDLAIESHNQMHKSIEAQKGIAAFFEKRPVDWEKE